MSCLIDQFPIDRLLEEKCPVDASGEQLPDYGLVLLSWRNRDTPEGGGTQASLISADLLRNWRKPAGRPGRILTRPLVADWHPRRVRLMKSINIGFDQR